MNEYTFKHLILLIGTNPLPNYVVATYFIKKNPNLEMIYLISSEENKSINQSSSEEIAKRLDELLKKKNERIQVILKYKINDISNDKSIIDNISTLCKEIGEENFVHFNYTAGTKSMIVHSYTTIKEFFKDNASFSYLDAKSFRLNFDKDKHCYSNSEDLRKVIKVNLDDLINLHNFKIIRESSIECFSELLKSFKQLIEDNKIYDFYKDFRRQEFLDKDENIAKFIEIEKIGNGKQISKESFDLLSKRNFQDDSEFLKMNNLLPDDFKLFDSEKKLISPNRNAGKVIKFFDGYWYERLIEEKLKEVSCIDQDNIYTNFEIKNKDCENPNQKFEIDIIYIKGYQFFGISITTSNVKNLCKSKGFEVIHRSKQIAGDEAKCILITLLSDENKASLVQQELQQVIGVNENIIVLGIDDLKHDQFKKKISNFIEGD